MSVLNSIYHFSNWYTKKKNGWLLTGLMSTANLSISSDSKESLLSSNDLDWVELREVLTETRQFDLVTLHPSQLASMVVAPTIDREVIAKGNYPFFWVPVVIV